MSHPQGLSDCTEEEFQKALLIMENIHSIYEFDEVLLFIKSHTNLSTEEILLQLHIPEEIFESDSNTSNNFSDAMNSSHDPEMEEVEEEATSFHLLLNEDSSNDYSIGTEASSIDIHDVIDIADILPSSDPVSAHESVREALSITKPIRKPPPDVISKYNHNNNNNNNNNNNHINNTIVDDRKDCKEDGKIVQEYKGRKGKYGYLVRSLSEEDFNFAKEMYKMVDKKYTMHEIAVVMKHAAKREQVAEILLNSNMVKQYMVLDSQLEALAAPNIDCPICFDDFPISDMYTIDCHSSHRICFTCVKTLITLQIQSGCLPRCPVLTNDTTHHVNTNNNNNNDNNKKNEKEKHQTCNYLLSEREVQQIFGEGEIWEKYKKVVLTIGLMNVKGCIGCPTPGCENWLEIDNSSSSKFRCDCNACGHSFCSLCRETYHYHTSCDEIPSIKMRWYEWIAMDRGEKEKETNSAATLQRRDEILRRIGDLERDEKWKEKHLRLCPHCNNPVEKMGGCDSMQCGQDFHGGNIQRGCGRKFNWKTAKPYLSPSSSSSSSSPLKFKLRSITIDEDDRKRLKKDHGDYVVCDHCLQRIFGYRFSCVHCPCFNLCESCELLSSHSPSHYFKIIS